MKKIHTAKSRFCNRKQSSVSIRFFAGVFVFSALTLAAVSAAGNVSRLFTIQAAQQTISGEWTAELNRGKPGEVQMTFHRRSENGGSNTSGDSISLAELQGLTAETAASAARANVNFSIVREAGTFQCEGFFNQGRGAGLWTFTPNRNFVSALQSRGYGNLTEEDLLRAALRNLTTKFIEDLKNAGYDRLEFEQLNRAATHNITAKFIGELESAGFTGLTFDQLIRARNHSINGEYVREVRAMGFDKQPLETIIRLRNHKITREFINRMSAAGFNNLSVEQLIRLKNHQITPEFVNDLKAEGFPDISVETAIRLKNHEIDRDFIRRVKARGFTNITLDNLLKLRSLDIIK